LRWIDWSSFPSPLSATESELAVKEPPGLKLNVPKLPEATPLKSAGLQDRGTLRIGFEHQLVLSESHGLPVRAGYAFIPTGLTEDSSANLVDADLQLLSAGTGLNWRAPSEVLPGTLKLDVHGQWGLLHERALSAQAGRDAENTEVTAGGYFVAAGLTLAYEFAPR
jgi:long-chain fatty acid transport protein